MPTDGVSKFIGTWKIEVLIDPEFPTKDSYIKSTDGITDEKIESLNDEIQYVVYQKVGVFNKDVFRLYKNMQIVDIIPSGLEYKDAKVYIQVGTAIADITELETYGKLEYDSENKIVKYIVNEDWLQNKNNYGQTFKLVINTRVVEALDSYNNIATTYINENVASEEEYELISNEVSDATIFKSPTYKYVSADSDIELPNAINVKTGDYRIDDTNEYLIGETANRSDVVPVGTQYKVYNDNNEVSAIWELVSYDKDTDIISDEDVINFTGTWKIEVLSEPIPPTKNSVINGDNNIDNVASINDEIQYIVKQKLGVFNKDVFRVYKNMEIVDTIPEGLEYKDAKVFIEAGTAISDITELETYGKLEYDSENKIVKYIVNEDWLQNKNNYGQTFKLVINTKVVGKYDDYNNTSNTYINKGIVNEEVIELESNKITDLSVLKQPKYTYISKDSNIKLPDEINTLEGQFKIENNKEYFNDEEVIRNDDIKVDTIYNIYDNKNKLVGYWKLVEWDKDSAIMSDDNVEFIGYWKYYEVAINPDTGDNIYLFVILSLVSFIVLLKGLLKLKNIKLY